MKKAAIDIGSNSILLLIAAIENKRVEPLLERYYFPRLGKGISARGMLSADRMAAAEAVLQQIRELIRTHGCTRTIACATAAVREARNGGDFVDRIHSALDLSIKVISGEEEAELTYLGAVSTGVEQDADIAVLDIGGGSTELTIGRGDCPMEVMSASTGSVKLFDNYGKNPGLVPSALEDIDRELRSAAQAAVNGKLVAVGGTATTLAAIQLGLEEYDAEALTGVDIGMQDIATCIERFRERSIEEIQQMPGMEQGRADIIESGATLLLRFMELSGHQHVTVTPRGLRYGMIQRY